MPLAWKSSSCIFLQHVENCVNTNVFARRGPHNIVNTVIFATRGKQTSGLRSAKNIGTYGVFCSESVKRRKSTTYVAIFWGQKNAKIRCVVTTTTTTNNKQQQQTEAQNATKSLLQAAVWKAHHTVLCTCAHAPSTWTTPTLTLLYITLMASPVCEALQYSIMNHRFWVSKGSSNIFCKVSPTITYSWTRNNFFRKSACF